MAFQRDCPITCYKPETGPTDASCNVGKVLQCFTCENCPNVNSESPLLRRSCHSNTVSCVTIILDKTKVVRGCNEGKLADLCDNTRDNCMACSTTNCNSVTIAQYCHQCTEFNPMCQYEQKDSFAMFCDYEDGFSLTDPYVCYSGLT